MACKVIKEFVYKGETICVGSVIDLPESERLIYRLYLDCSVSGSGKDPKPEDHATP